MEEYSKFSTFKNKVETAASILRKKYPELRRGQSLSNALFNVAPDLYKRIFTQENTGSDSDPFYKDENIPNFWGLVESYFNEEVSD